MCRVDEEAGHNAVPLSNLFVVNLTELASNHAEIVVTFGIVHLYVWAYVRYLNGLEDVLVGACIAEAVNVWIYGELVWLLGLVEDEVRGEKAKISKFIALSLEASLGKLED